MPIHPSGRQYIDNITLRILDDKRQVINFHGEPYCQGWIETVVIRMGFVYKKGNIMVINRRVSNSSSRGNSSSNFWPKLAIHHAVYRKAGLTLGLRSIRSVMRKIGAKRKVDMISENDILIGLAVALLPKKAQKITRKRWKWVNSYYAVVPDRVKLNSLESTGKSWDFVKYCFYFVLMLTFIEFILMLTFIERVKTLMSR